MTKPKTFAIVGGGIGGLTLAIAMQRKGFPVTVYERAPAIAPVGAGIVLAANALKAYRALGLEEEVISAGNQMQRFCIRNAKGRVLTTTDTGRILSEFGAVTSLTLHRADLHAVLLRNLKSKTLITGKSCVGFDQESNGVRIQFADGSVASSDYVIAADGINSVFRRKLVPSSRPRYSGYTCWRGITDNLPEDFNPEEATETWGTGKRFGIVPLSRGRVYWFATVNASFNDPVTDSFTASDIAALFHDFHSPVSHIINNTPQGSIIKNDICDISPLKKFSFGNIVLLGDAAHATTPNLGQGACMAIEDAVVLANCLTIQSNFEAAFIEFERMRIRRTTTIVKTSWRMGKLAQASNPLIVWLRELALRATPERVTDNQLRFLFDVSF